MEEIYTKNKFLSVLDIFKYIILGVVNSFSNPIVIIISLIVRGVLSSITVYDFSIITGNEGSGFEINYINIYLEIFLCVIINEIIIYLRWLLKYNNIDFIKFNKIYIMSQTSFILILFFRLYLILNADFLFIIMWIFIYAILPLTLLYIVIAYSVAVNYFNKKINSLNN